MIKCVLNCQGCDKDSILFIRNYFSTGNQNRNLVFVCKLHVPFISHMILKKLKARTK